MEARWYGCEIISGGVIEELPVEPQGSLGSRLGAYSSAAVNIPIPKAPAGWVEACEPGRTMLVLDLDYGDGPALVWGGLVLEELDGTVATAQRGLVTLEGYLDRRYVGNHTWVGADESVIVSGLVGDAQTEGIGFTLDLPAAGTTRDRTYLNKDNKTVYSALRELMGVIGGPEWTVELAWNADHSAVVKTFKLRPRIGTGVDPPAAVFQSAGESSASYTYRLSWGAGDGANHVVAYSSGEGDDQPFSSPARDEAGLASGFPRFEHRFQPSTSITNVSTLDGHAERALEIMRAGARAFTVSARLGAYPRLGVDWRLGDDVGMDLYGHRHPTGIVATRRCIGWDLDLRAETVAPVLLVPGEELVA
jgi:hypothetical protein